MTGLKEELRATFDDPDVPAKNLALRKAFDRIEVMEAEISDLIEDLETFRKIAAKESDETDRLREVMRIQGDLLVQAFASERAKIVGKRLLDAIDPSQGDDNVRKNQEAPLPVQNPHACGDMTELLGQLRSGLENCDRDSEGLQLGGVVAAMARAADFIEFDAAEKARLLSALHAAISRPAGVVPDVALEFYDACHPALGDMAL